MSVTISRKKVTFSSDEQMVEAFTSLRYSLKHSSAQIPFWSSSSLKLTFSSVSFISWVLLGMASFCSTFVTNSSSSSLCVKVKKLKKSLKFFHKPLNPSKNSNVLKGSMFVSSKPKMGRGIQFYWCLKNWCSSLYSV